jgi:hypothetical protein
MGTIVFFGIVFLLLGVSLLFMKSTPRRLRGNGRQNPLHPQFVDNKLTFYGLLTGSFLIGTFLVLFPYLFLFADQGFNYVLVHPSGKRTAIMDEGLKWRGFAKITTWPKFIDIKVVSNETDSGSKTDIINIDELEGVMKPIPIRFIDQVTAHAMVSVRFHIPDNEDKFLSLAREFKTVDNLVQTTLIPTVKETMSNTAYMFAAQDYISGEAQSFRHTFEDQLSNGSFVIRKQTIYDTVYESIETPDNKKIKAIRTSYKIIKIKDDDGRYKRIPNEITKSGVIVSQAIVDDIDLDPTFKKRLEAQRDESAKRQLEQQKIKTAKDAQARILAEGERDKSAERVKREKAQIAQVIELETQVKMQEKEKQLAKIKLETERLNSETRKVKADAEAYEISKKVKAGITPEVRLKMELDAKVDVAKELSKTKWPTYYIVSGSKDGKSNSNPLETLVTAAMVKQLNN